MIKRVARLLGLISSRVSLHRLFGSDLLLLEVLSAPTPPAVCFRSTKSHRSKYLQRGLDYVLNLKAL